MASRRYYVVERKLLEVREFVPFVEIYPWPPQRVLRTTVFTNLDPANEVSLALQAAFEAGIEHEKTRAKYERKAATNGGGNGKHAAKRGKGQRGRGQAPGGGFSPGEDWSPPRHRPRVV